MLKISNVKVYGLEESIIASGYPHRIERLSSADFNDSCDVINYQKNGQRKIKSFNNKDDAIRQRLKWEHRCFGEFAPQKHLYDKFLKEDDIIDKSN